MLEGIRVLDLSSLLPGPYCSMLLAEYGAEVIKIEQPGKGDLMRHIGVKIDEDSAYFHQINRNKKSITLNLKSEKELKYFNQLVKKSDVIIESYRPGVTNKLGIDYASVKKINPKIVYCSISGYGQNGPYKNKAGHDINYLAIAGYFGLKGNKQPALSVVQIADMGGALFGTVGILLALFQKEKTGVGNYFDLSMTDCVISWLSLYLSQYFVSRNVPAMDENIFTGAFACYNLYETKDGKYFSLGAVEGNFWGNFCRKIERPDFISKQFSLADQEEIIKTLQSIFKQETREEWVKIFKNEDDVCCEPVLSLDEMLNHPQIAIRNLLSESSDKKVSYIKAPLRFQNKPRQPYKPSPKLGEDTRIIELNLDKDVST